MQVFSRQRCQFILIGLLSILFLIPSHRMARAKNAPYMLAVVPQLPQLTISRNWTPLVNHLTAATGLNLQLQIYPSIPEFERALRAGEPDFAYMNPYHAVIAHQSQGYMPLLRDSAKQLTGILVVHRDSPISSIAELDGAVLAFPAPNAFGASLYMRALLAKQGVRFTARYVKTHANVYRNVIRRKVTAGGGVSRTLQAEPHAVQAALRVLYKTPGVMAHPIGAHPRVSAQVREQFTQAFLHMAQDRAGKTILAHVHVTEPIRADYRRDYAPLMHLALDAFVVQTP